MKRFIYYIIDLLVVYGSIFCVFYLLGLHGFLREYNRNFDAFKYVMPMLAVIYFVFQYVYDVNNTIRKNLGEIIYSVFLVSISLVISTMGICFLFREVSLAFPRSVILISGLVYFIILSCLKSLVWQMDRKIHGIKTLTVISSDNEKLSDEIESKYSGIYKIENRLNDQDNILSEHIKDVDEVFISANVIGHTRRKVLKLCIDFNKDLFFVPSIFDLSIMSSALYKTGDIPTFLISNVVLSGDQRVLKRLMDILLSIIALIISIPFFLILAALIKLDGGKVFYVQERLTEGGKIFKMIKFRTMIPDAEKISGPVLAEHNDPRITAIGRFMRAVRLDELPQLINILKGEMSIVGPRPERLYFTEQFVEEMPEYKYRLKVKAGLTGLAQVEGKYNTSAEDKLRYDLIYINNFSIWNDIVIILQTIKILFMKSSTEGVKIRG